MSQWFYGMDMGHAEVESDFRVGGEYVIRMFKADGSSSDCADYAPHGKFLEIDAPNKVSFTWVSVVCLFVVLRTVMQFVRFLCV